MSEQKKILVPGGTGAMGIYLVPELLSLGYKVDVVSLDDVESDNPNLRCFKANFRDDVVVDRFLKNEYDCIVDFMIYNGPDFRVNFRRLVENCGHYIYLSSYRVYANEEHPITERSPRLIDVSTDTAFLAARDNEYSLYKAMGEDVLRTSGLTNWTAIRPAITFSKRRFQLVILEADTIVWRAKTGKTVVLPQEALNVRATMSWAGDVAKMISRLVLSADAFGEIYTVATAEHNPWGTVAEYYHDLIGLKYITVGKEEFLSCLSPVTSGGIRWQLDYDRLFDRTVDNGKILGVTGMKQSELTTVYDGLKRELTALPADAFLNCGNTDRNRRMDAYLEEHGL
ncbi:MAG: NAD-dependent epimerase/dehydratase family protein [Eubacteriales bacterium]|nr:NAD-dependent epimerase/dehydratase family protein [Eubacteriales bacterium]